MEEGASKVSGTNPLPAQGQETPLTKTPRPDAADTDVTSSTRQVPTQLIEDIGAEQTSAGISAPSPDTSTVSQNAEQMQAKPDAPIAETQAQSTSQEDSEGQDEAPKLPWSPDDEMASSLAEDSAEGTTVFELPRLDAYGDPITYALTDGDGNPLTGTAFEVRDNTIVLGTSPELDFENTPEQVIHVTAITEGGTSGPWPITLTVTDVAEDLTLGDTGVEFTDIGVAETGISGGTGDDTITGHDDGATIAGGAGDDLVTGAASDDDLTGGTGADTLIGNGGADTLYGGSGTDLLDGGVGDDRITAGTGWDTVYGGEGADTISGGSGGDELYGGGGDDLFTAGPGDDTLDGGDGVDVAVFSGTWAEYTITETDGVFTVTDNRSGSPDGTDRLINIELFRFADGDVTPADALNDGPALTATGGHITENVAGAAIGTVDASDPDVGDSLTILVDDPRFEVADGFLRLRDGESLDYEEDTSLDLTITVTDSHGATESQTVTVTVGNVNEHAAGPVADTDSATNAVQENAPIGTTVGITAFASDEDAPDTATYHLSDDAGGRFAIDPETGIVTVAAPLDHETADSHSIEVTATSSDGSTSSHVFTIAVTDQNEAPVITSDGGGDSAHFTIDENTSAVTTLTADTEAGETLSYAIAGGADAALFTVDPATGALTFISPPDHEIPSDTNGDNTYEVRIEASDGTLTDSQTVSVTVADVNEGPNVTAEDGTVAENAAGAVVGSVTGYDPDAGDSLTYTTDDARFEVVEGELRLRDGVSLDHESEETIDVTVTATDAAGLSDSQIVTVTVADVNEGPNLTSEDGTIAENAAGAVIGSVTGYDPDAGDSLTYTTDDARFEVVGGELRLRDGVSLDHESEETIDVTVTATDAAGLSDSQTVSVTVADVNEGPNLTAEDGTVAENAAGAVVGSVTASDPDEGDSQTYTTDDARFEVVDGQLRLRDGESLDYETDGQAITLTVTATDSQEASDSQTVTINIDDQAEAISLTDEGVGFTDTGVAETLITGGDGNDTIVAHDDGGNIDGGGGNDSLAGGGADDTITGGSGFDTIHGGGGNDVLSGDAGRDSLSGGFGDDTLDGGVWDDTLDGGDGRDSLFGGDGRDSLMGGSGNDTLDGGTWHDTLDGGDGDDLISGGTGMDAMQGGTGADTLSGGDWNDTLDGGADDDLLDGGAGNDTIVGGSGADIATFSGARADYTISEADGVYTVVDIRPDSPDGTDTITNVEVFRFADGDVDPANALNDAPTLTTEDGTVAENAAGAVVGSVTGYDPDAGDSLTYTTDDARFEVVDGELRLRDGVSLDHESEETVDVTVTATDAAGLSDSQIVTVTVADVNEGPSVTAEDGTVAENAAGAVVGAVTGYDPDAGDSLTYTTDDARFEVVGGELRLRDGVSLDHESEETIEVTVTATDAAGLSDSQTVTVTVADVNEGPSVTAEDGTIAENAAGAVVGSVSGYDPDAGDTLTYSTDDARFEVVEGELRLRDGVSLDHESEETIEVTVTATDAAGLSDSRIVTVTVADVNEGPSVTVEDGTVAENAAGAVVGSVTDYDPDAGDTLTYTTDDARFEVVGGELRLRDGVSLDHESDETLDVTVTATDAAGLSDSQIVTVTVADVNEGPEVSVTEAGFTARYFDVSHDIHQLADIDWSATPTAYENISEINFADSHNSFWADGGTDTFGAQITGNFLVETGGEYTFYLSADDGAVLYVDGRQWIDNDGQHSFQTATATITLSPGAHTIEVRYFENYGSAGLQLEWDGPDTDGRTLLQASTEVAIAENSAGVVLGTVSASDPDDGDVVTYSVDDDRFEVVNGAVQVRDGASFDFESGETQVSLTITATDSQGATDSHVMTMTVRDTGEDIVLADGGAGFTDTGVAESSITGGSGADTITGHDDGAVIDGAEGDDQIAGGAGDDSLSGGFGDDSVSGGAGDDTLSGEGVQNFVVNGSFEDTDGAAHSDMLARMSTIDGWTDANGTVFEMHEDGYSGQYATDGNHWLDMSESGAQMDISQTISGLGTGEAYRLSFDAGNYGSDLPGVMEVYFGGELIATIDPDTQDVMNTYTFDIEGGSGDGSNTLRFVEVGTNLNVGTSLDNVQIVAVDTGGNDTLDGGDGTDHAIWDGDVEDFGVVYDSTTGTFTITDLNSEDGNEGVDTVTNVEVFEFNGTAYSHDEMVRIAELQANAAPTDMKFAANRDLSGVDGSQVETVVTGTIQTNSENKTTIDRWQIDHTGGDLTIDVLADGVPAGGLDSGMVLLRLNGDGSYTVVAANDDGAPGNDGSANGTDSYIAETGLAAGTYILAIGAYPVTEGEASDTTNTYSDSQNTGGDYQITFTGNSSIAVAENPASGGTWGDPAGVATVVSETALEGALGMGSVVAQVDGVSDADDTTHSFSLSADAGGLFAIDSNTGEISLTDDPRDGSASQHTVTVVATDDTGEHHSEEIGLTFGTEGDNTLAGTAGNDVIYGFDGTNLITGGAGDDTIVGGAAGLSGPEWRSVYDNNDFHGTAGTDYYTVTANTGDYAVIRLNDSPNTVLGDGVADYVNIETTNNNVTLVISDFDFGTDSIILNEAYSNVSVNAQTDYADFHLTYANGNQQVFRIYGLDGNNYPSQIFTTTVPDFALSGGDTVQFSGNASDFDISYDTATATFTITDLNTQDGLDEGTDLVSGVERFSFNGVEYDATDFMGASSVAADAFDYDTGFATAHPNATHNGNTSSETATTGHSDQVIYTRAGDDIVTSGDGNDVIYAGSGADTVTAGAGDDTIFGGTGDDLMNGGDGNDIFMVTAMQGADTINGGAGWIDTLELAGFTGDITIDGNMVDGDGWTLLLDAGYEVTGQTLDSLDLSADATGVITFDEGGTIDFTGIEKITF